ADLEPEHRALLHGAFIEEQVVTMQVHRHVIGVFRRTDAGHVIDMRMRQEDRLYADVQVAYRTHQLIDLVTWIDDHRVASALAADDEAVFIEGRNRPNLEKHLATMGMIVCAIDDLLFSIKISTAAKQLGVNVYFERFRDRL